MSVISPFKDRRAVRDLFDWAGISAAHQARDSGEPQGGVPFLRLVWSDTASSSAIEADQLFFAFPENPRPVSFVSKRRENYLDFGVYDTFRDVPGAAKPALKLEAQGVYVLGQLVQLSEGRLRAFRFLTEDQIAMFKARLAKVDLYFDMRLPRWNACQGTHSVSVA